MSSLGDFRRCRGLLHLPDSSFVFMEDDSEDPQKIATVDGSSVLLQHLGGLVAVQHHQPPPFCCFFVSAACGRQTSW